jgi:hypothetical protein
MAKVATHLRALGRDRICVSAYRLDPFHVNTLPSCRPFPAQPSAPSIAKSHLPGLIRSAGTGPARPKTKTTS